MAEYLSPGVYVEGFDSGPAPMQGVGTSTAGFAGLAEKGPVIGAPVFVTSAADFNRKFGGYLQKSEFGEYRVVVLEDGSEKEYNRVSAMEGSNVTMEKPFEAAKVVDTALLPRITVRSCEMAVKVRCGETVETYENASFNITIPNFIEKLMSKSELVDVTAADNSEAVDPLDKRDTFIPPSGSVLGIYARSDNTRGVHKAPANETVANCTGLSVTYNTAEQDMLNPNDELLWIRVRRTIEVFLKGVWKSGALAGSTAADAFFVNIGSATMTKDDIDNGRLICVIGVAPVKPAEFVIFRLTQKTGEQEAHAVRHHMG